MKDHNNPEFIVGLRALGAALGKSHDTARTWSDTDKTFPAPFLKGGPRRVSVWRRTDVEAWLAKRGRVGAALLP